MSLHAGRMAESKLAHLLHWETHRPGDELRTSNSCFLAVSNLTSCEFKNGTVSRNTLLVALCSATLRFGASMRQAKFLAQLLTLVHDSCDCDVWTNAVVAAHHAKPECNPVERFAQIEGALIRRVDPPTNSIRSRYSPVVLDIVEEAIGSYSDPEPDP